MAREFSRRLYNSKAWKDVRQLVLRKYHGMCTKCGDAGSEVHHIIHLNEKNINDPYIALGLDNLTLLCESCHRVVHGYSEPIKKDFCFDEFGNYIPKNKIK